MCGSVDSEEKNEDASADPEKKDEYASVNPILNTEKQE